MHGRPFVPLVGIVMGLTAARVGLLILYPYDFAGLTGSQLAGAFARGLRFDLSIALLFVGLPVWLMWLPIRFGRSRAWQALWGLIAFLAMAAAWGLALADLIYFGDVRRHIGSDLANAWGSDSSTLLRSVLDYPLPLLGFVAFMAVVGVVWWSALKMRAPRPRPGVVGWVVWGLTPVLALVGIRGGLQADPLRPIDAFATGTAAIGNLVLNGPFSAIHSIRDPGPVEFTGDFDAALADVRSRFTLGDEEWVGPEVPLERTRAAGRSTVWSATRRPPNIVVLVLESWDASITDAIRTREGLDPLGATPVIDDLAGRGILFTRFFANGQRSLEGLTALLASYPTLPGLPYVSDAPPGTELSYLGMLAKEQGYATYMVRSARKESFDLGTVAQVAGFDEYFGFRDIAALASHTHVPPAKWGAWDFDSLRFLDERLRSEDRPFVAFFFGSSTHTPFPSPGDQWTPFRTDTEDGRYLNAVSYVDWAVGQFMDLARRGGYYDDTIFVVISDQGSRMNRALMSPERFRIPAVIFGPGVPRGVVDDRVSSQMDILPTLVEAAGWQTSYAGFGESLLRERDQRALLKTGSLVMRVDPEGWVLHTLRRRVAGDGPPELLDTLDRKVVEEAQVLTGLFYQNRIYRPQPH